MTLLYSLLLYLHLVSMAVLFGSMGVFQLAVRQVRSARDVGQARAALGVMVRLKHVFPACGIALLATGSEMARSRGMLGHGWVMAAMLGVVFLTVLGATVNPRWGRRVGMALATVETPAGPLPESVREAALRPSIMVGSYASMGVTLGIVGVMVARPVGVLPAAAVLAAGGLVGLAVSLRFVRRSPAPATGALATERQPVA